MRGIIRGFVLTVAVLLPTMGTAQVYQIRTPMPEVTAGTAEWQVRNDAIVFGSLIYYPTREFRMFDGQVMAQVGIYERVPIYADTTREPFTVIYVPLSRDRMRTYEHPRTLELTGTSLTRAQTARVETLVVPSTLETATVSTAAVPAVTAPAATPATPSVVVGTSGTVVGTGGTIVPRATDVTATPSRTARRVVIQTLERPRGINGVWMEFNGARWFSAGDAVSYSPDRFTQIGEYRGFPVYRDQSITNEIWVAAVKDGLIAPYKKR